MVTYDIHGTIFGNNSTNPGTTVHELVCSGVTVVGSASKCTVRSPGQAAGTIKSESLKGTLVWLNESVTNEVAGLKMGTAAGATWLKLEVSGAECPVASAKPYLVSGEVIGAILPIATEVESGEWNFPAAPTFTWWNNATPRVKQSIEGNRLKLGIEGGGTSNATFTGKFSTALIPKEKYGVFAG